MAQPEKGDRDRELIDDDSSSTVTVEPETEPTKLSIGKLVAYGVGGLTILVGVSMLVDSFFSGVIMIAAGVFGTPPGRALVEDEFEVELSRWLAVIIFLSMVVFAGATASPS